MENTINNLFINAICNTAEEKTILVKFYHRGDLISYPARMMDLFKSDTQVQDIINPDTGEVVFTHDNI